MLHYELLLIFGMPHKWACLGCRLPQMKHGTHTLDGWCLEVAFGHYLQPLYPSSIVWWLSENVWIKAANFVYSLAK